MGRGPLAKARISRHLRAAVGHDARRGREPAAGHRLSAHAQKAAATQSAANLRGHWGGGRGSRAADSGSDAMAGVVARERERAAGKKTNPKRKKNPRKQKKEPTRT